MTALTIGGVAAAYLAFGGVMAHHALRGMPGGRASRWMMFALLAVLWPRAVR